MSIRQTTPARNSAEPGLRKTESRHRSSWVAAFFLPSHETIAIFKPSQFLEMAPFEYGAIV
jgi:hypothetical protein